MEELMLIPTKVSLCQRLLEMLRLNFGKVVVCGFITVFSTVVILTPAILLLRGGTVDSASTVPDAVAFFKSLNRNIDPCYDFYSYCCSRWHLKEGPTEDGEALVTQFNVLQKKINSELLNILENVTNISDLPIIVQKSVHFYNSCINPVDANETSLLPLLSFFSLIGGWPILNDSTWSESSFVWSKAAAETLKVFGIHTFVGFYISVDDKNTSQNLIMLGPPVLNNELLSSKSSSALHMLYLIIKTLSFQHVQYSELSSDLVEVTKFEEALHNLIKPMHEIKVFVESSKMSIGKLQKKIPQLDWVHFIQSVVNISSQENILIHDKSEILVYNVECLKNIIDLLESNTFSQRAIANFIGSVVVQELYIVIPGAFEKYAQFFGMTEVEILKDLKQICFEKMSKSFVLPLDYLYVQNVHDFDRNKSAEFMKYLKNAFRHLTIDSKWLDNETKLSAIHKLDIMMEVIGYPAVLDNASELDKLYENFPVMSLNVLQNYILISEFLIMKEMKKLGSMNRREKFLPPRSVTDVGAYYVLNWNALVYPLSIHNIPFYYKNGPWYANFGAVGSVIAHEITHAFDILGHERDGFGNFHNWWTNSSLLEYKERAQCFENQFSDYRICNTSQNINGAKTLGENIADSGGLRQAYAAYQLWKADNGEENVLPGLENYTSEQLFFISFASVWCTKMPPGMELELYGNDTHSPPALRVLGSVSNSVEFAKAFNCSKGTPMNPEKKCLLW